MQNGDQSVGENTLFQWIIKGNITILVAKSKRIEVFNLIQNQLRMWSAIFFINVSCAEFLFKPLKRLLSNYILKTTGQIVDLTVKGTFLKLFNRTFTFFHITLI